MNGVGISTAAHERPKTFPHPRGSVFHPSSPEGASRYSPEHVHGLGFALIVAGVSMAWFGAGALFLILFGSTTGSAMHLLPQILLVSGGGGLIGSGLYIWFSTRSLTGQPIGAEAHRILPPAERLQRVAGGLLATGGVGSLPTWAFIHSVLWGWHPGGLMEALEVLMFYPGPLLFGLGLVLLGIAAFE